MIIRWKAWCLRRIVAVRNVSVMVWTFLSYDGSPTMAVVLTESEQRFDDQLLQGGLFSAF